MAGSKDVGAEEYHLDSFDMVHEEAASTEESARNQARDLHDPDQPEISSDDDDDDGDEETGTFLPGAKRQRPATDGKLSLKFPRWHGTLPSWATSRVAVQPQTLAIHPIWPSLQNAVSNLVDTFLPGQAGQLAVAAAIFVLWLVAFAAIFHYSLTTSDIIGLKDISRLSCDARFWHNSTVCGLNGDNCQPFDQEIFSFWCPAGCASQQILEPHYVGDVELNYQPLVVGGPGKLGNGHITFYRGDSFICSSAIHAGKISDTFGGCGVVRRTGVRAQYQASENHGIQSVGFVPFFPLSFVFEMFDGRCGDPQWFLLPVAVVATVVAAVCLSSAPIFYGLLFLIVHFQVALASEPPYQPAFTGIVSIAFARLLPSLAVGFVIYYFAVKHTLSGLEAHIEKAVLWVGACWVGALNKYTFDQLPISRLTPHDLKQQPGAILTLVVILLILVPITVFQAYAFWKEGRFVRYASYYLAVGVLLVVLAAAPGLELRLHHYLIALILLPGTAVQTRPSLVFQGLLVGMFINGVARWGFASVLETPAALIQDGGRIGSEIPVPAVDVFNDTTVKITFNNMAGGFQGLSVLVNDVERFWERSASVPLDFMWTRDKNPFFPNEPTFFRYAYTSKTVLGKHWYGDLSRPSVWQADGTWIDPE